jgi:hypothetical protein
MVEDGILLQNDLVADQAAGPIEQIVITLTLHYQPLFDKATISSSG